MSLLLCIYIFSILKVLAGYTGGLHNKPSILGTIVLSTQMNSQFCESGTTTISSKEITTYSQQPAQQKPSQDSHGPGLSLTCYQVSREKGSMPMGTLSNTLHFHPACLSPIPAFPSHMILDHPWYKFSLHRGLQSILYYTVNKLTSSLTLISQCLFYFLLLGVELCPPKYVKVLTPNAPECDLFGNSIFVNVLKIRWHHTGWGWL